MTVIPLDQLSTRWRELSAEFQALSATLSSQAFLKCAEELDAARAALSDVTLEQAVDLLREWCEQEGWTDASVNDHVNVCREFIERYDRQALAVRVSPLQEPK